MSIVNDGRQPCCSKSLQQPQQPQQPELDLNLFRELGLDDIPRRLGQEVVHVLLNQEGHLEQVNIDMDHCYSKKTPKKRTYDTESGTNPPKKPRKKRNISNGVRFEGISDSWVPMGPEFPVSLGPPSSSSASASWEPQNRPFVSREDIEVALRNVPSQPMPTIPESSTITSSGFLPSFTSTFSSQPLAAQPSHHSETQQRPPSQPVPPRPLDLTKLGPRKRFLQQNSYWQPQNSSTPTVPPPNPTPPPQPSSRIPTAPAPAKEPEPAFISPIFQPSSSPLFPTSSRTQDHIQINKVYAFMYRCIQELDLSLERKNSPLQGKAPAALPHLEKARNELVLGHYKALGTDFKGRKRPPVMEVDLTEEDN